ncbi:MAG TPA: TetR/AcrR family transcriptional regulator [Pseudonocardiaceae bacterium]|nr:TetR/AcrR family transcriptional regulator [Pseudonocardiaceae bacterium]
MLPKPEESADEAVVVVHDPADPESGRIVVVDPADPESGRERVMRAAYDLFSRQGTRTVGVDAVIGEAGVAKMTLYRNFASKDDLILAFLERREALWTHGWVRAESQRRGDTPAQRLLAIFEIFGEWFAQPDFEGCSFITTLLEVTARDSPVRNASVLHLANIRGYLCELAAEAGVQDPDSFARQWHILMKGSIVAAAEGDIHAASRARDLGMLLLDHHGIAP